MGNAERLGGVQEVAANRHRCRPLLQHHPVVAHQVTCLVVVQRMRAYGRQGVQRARPTMGTTGLAGTGLDVFSFITFFLREYVG